MARKPLRPLIRGGGFYPSRKWTPLVYAGGYTTANGGGEPEPPPIEKTITGNPIHITDALAKPVQALSIALEPIQDLNGYDNPWPSGGGKNKFDVSAIVPYNSNATVTKDGGSFTVVNNNSYVAAMFCDASGHTMQFPVTDGKYSISIGEATTVAIGVYGSTDGINFSWLANGIQFGNTSATFTVSGQIYVEFRASAPANGSATIKNFMFESGETAHSWQPYSNICPISGHTDADVTRTGKNLIDKSDFEQTGNFVWGYRNVGFALKSGITYTLSSNFDFDSMRFVSVDEQTVYANKTSPNTLRYTPSEDVLVVIRLWHSSSFDYSSITIQLELGSTASSYEAYVGTTYPIPLGTTVYGGQLDVLTGVLTVTHAFGTYNGSENWNMGTNYVVLWNQPPSKSNDDTTQIANWLVGGGTSYADQGKFRVQTNGALCVGNIDGKYADATAFKAVLAETPLQICYELATPTTIQLTPTQVELLLGENNLWSEGEMTLVYLADGNASDEEALNILLGNRYVNNHGEDEPTDREALDIVLGGTK